MSSNTTQINVMGGFQAGTAAIQTAFSIAAMAKQYEYAKANIQHQIDMTDMAKDHGLRKINYDSETMARVQAVGKLINESAVDRAEAEAGLSVAQSKLAQLKITNHSAKLAKAKAFKALLNKRGSYSYGRTYG